jgi:hypothetical protein
LVELRREQWMALERFLTAWSTGAYAGADPADRIVAMPKWAVGKALAAGQALCWDMPLPREGG